jgi:hypothetical protein
MFRYWAEISDAGMLMLAASALMRYQTMKNRDFNM